MLNELQERLWKWEVDNFGTPDDLSMQLTMGAAEEVGELTHAVLKRRQGIRRMDNDDIFKDAAQDAIGDICVYLMNLCSIFNWNFEKIIEDTAESVLMRNWKKNQANGEKAQ